MAGHDAIAAVSRTLRTLLMDRMVTGAQVTIAPPDVNVGVDGARVNLYLCEVVENAHLKNQSISEAGQVLAHGRPPLSLNLRYLLTTHSKMEAHADADLNAQILLGDAMRVLHDFGHLVDTLTVTGTGDPVLDEVLTDEFERVKITLRPASLEDVTRIWSALPDANFRRSVIYEVTVVQIQTPGPKPIPKPVEERRIIATVRRRPQILSAHVEPSAPADRIDEIRARIGDEIVIVAEHALAERLYVRLGGLEPIRVSAGGAGEIRILIPDAAYPVDLDHPAPRPIPPDDQLQPGVLEIRLLAAHPVDGVKGGQGPGEAIAEMRPYASNAALLQLVPKVTAVSTGPGTLTVDGTRLWHAGARKAEVIVGDAAVAIRKDASPPPTPTSVQVPLAEVAAFLPTGVPLPVAVELDGARSRDSFSVLGP